MGAEQLDAGGSLARSSRTQPNRYRWIRIVRQPRFLASDGSAAGVLLTGRLESSDILAKKMSGPSELQLRCPERPPILVQMLFALTRRSCHLRRVRPFWRYRC